MNSHLRTGAAVVAGLIAWPVAASVGNLVLRQAFDGYRDAEPAMAFSITMLIGRLAVGLAASVASGVAARLVAGRPGPGPWIAGLMLFAAFVPVHLALWGRFPVAYHLFFLASLVAVPPLSARVVVSARR